MTVAAFLDTAVRGLLCSLLPLKLHTIQRHAGPLQRLVGAGRFPCKVKHVLNRELFSQAQLHCFPGAATLGVAW